MDVAKKLSFEDMSLSLTETLAEEDPPFGLAEVVQNLNQLTSSLENISNTLYSEIKQHKSVALQHLNSTGGRQAIEERYRAIKENLKTMQMKELFLEFIRDSPGVAAFSAAAAAAAESEAVDRAVKAAKSRISIAQQSLAGGAEQRMHQTVAALAIQYEDLNTAIGSESQAIAAFFSEFEEYQSNKALRLQQSQQQQQQLHAALSSIGGVGLNLKQPLGSAMDIDHHNDYHLRPATEMVEDLLREISAEEAMAALLEREAAAAAAAEGEERDARVALESEIQDLERQIQAARDERERRLRRGAARFEEALLWHRSFLDAVESLTGAAIVATADPDQIVLKISQQSNCHQRPQEKNVPRGDLYQSDGRVPKEFGAQQNSGATTTATTTARPSAQSDDTNHSPNESISNVNNSKHPPQSLRQRTGLSSSDGMSALRAVAAASLSQDTAAIWSRATTNMNSSTASMTTAAEGATTRHNVDGDVRDIVERSRTDHPTATSSSLVDASISSNSNNASTCSASNRKSVGDALPSSSNASSDLKDAVAAASTSNSLTSSTDLCRVEASAQASSSSSSSSSRVLSSSASTSSTSFSFAERARHLCPAGDTTFPPASSSASAAAAEASSSASISTSSSFAARERATALCRSSSEEEKEGGDGSEASGSGSEPQRLEATLRLMFKPGTSTLQDATLEPNVLPRLSDELVDSSGRLCIFDAPTLAAFVLKVKVALWQARAARSA